MNNFVSRFVSLKVQEKHYCEAVNLDAFHIILYKKNSAIFIFTFCTTKCVLYGCRPRCLYIVIYRNEEPSGLAEKASFRKITKNDSQTFKIS